MLAVAFVLGQEGDPQAVTRPSSTDVGEGIPAEKLRELAAQWTPYDSELTDRKKLRRYRFIIVEGRRLEEEYPEAKELSTVRDLMLGALRGVYRLTGEERWQKELVELARSIVASDAPQVAKFQADMLLTQALVESLWGHDQQGEAFDELRQFVDRYIEAPAPIALKAVQVAHQIIPPSGVGRGVLAEDVLSKLSVPKRRFIRQNVAALKAHHGKDPAVEAWLLELEGLEGFLNKPLHLRLPRLDGGELLLPRDLVGRPYMLVFWTINALRGRGYQDTISQIQKSLAPSGLVIVGVNLDDAPDRVAQYAKEEGLDWLHTYLRGGTKSQQLRRLMIPRIPFLWRIGPDGRVQYIEPKGGKVETIEAAWKEEQHWRDIVSLSHRVAWLQWARTGVLLVPDSPGDEASASGKRLLAIGERVLSASRQDEPLAERAAKFREAMKLCKELSKEDLGRGEHAAAMHWEMLAGRWLQVMAEDPSAGAQAVAVSQAALADSDAPSETVLLADFILTSDRLYGPDLRPDADEFIRAFLSRHEAEEEAWAAVPLALILSMEAGQDALREEIVERLKDEYRQEPKLRGFLRSVAGVEFFLGKELRAKIQLLAGGDLQLPDDLKNEVVFVHFWTSDHLPHAAFVGRKELFGRHRGLESDWLQGVRVVGINLNRQRDVARAAIEEHGLDWIHGFSGKGFDDPTAKALGVGAVPSSWVIGRDGRILISGRPLLRADRVFEEVTFNSPAPDRWADEPHGDADSPKALLENNKIALAVSLPDPEAGFYGRGRDGYRFANAGAVVYCRALGHTFIGSQATDGHSSYSMGTSDEFVGPGAIFLTGGLARSYKRGNSLRIGVGVCTSRRWGQVRDRAAWKIDRGDTWIRLLQTGGPFEGWAYEYEKRIELLDGQPGFLATYRLRNTGDKPIEVEHYSLNRMRVDGQPFGPGYRFLLPYDLDKHVDRLATPEPEPAPEWLQMRGGKVTIRPGQKTPRFWLRTDVIQDPKANTIAFEAPTAEGSVVGMKIMGDQGGFRHFIDCSGKDIHPQTFTLISLEPGEEKVWSIRYLCYESSDRPPPPTTTQPTGPSLRASGTNPA